MAAPEGKPSDATPDEPGASSGNGASDPAADSAVKESGNGTGTGGAGAETTDASPLNGVSDKKLEQHHVAKILDEVLEERPGEMSFKHPMLLDVSLAIGLLLAVAGFMIGIMNMWIAHQAKESIMHKNYKAAISMLKGVPFSEFNLFTVPGADSPNELMAQALYQEAMEKLDANPEDQSAIEELSRSRPEALSLTMRKK